MAAFLLFCQSSMGIRSFQNRRKTAQNNSRTVALIFEQLLSHCRDGLHLTSFAVIWSCFFPGNKSRCAIYMKNISRKRCSINKLDWFVQVSTCIIDKTSIENFFNNEIHEQTRKFLKVAALTDGIASGISVWFVVSSDCLAFLASWRLVPRYWTAKTPRTPRGRFSIFHNRKIKKFKNFLKNEKELQDQQLANPVFWKSFWKNKKSSDSSTKIFYRVVTLTDGMARKFAV